MTITRRHERMSDRCTPIRIAAALITQEDGRTLLVRKQRTAFFMQPGGRLQDGETALEALARELQEELGCRILSATFVGVFSAPPANEPLQHVEAMLFRTTIAGAIKPAAEIEQVAWVDPFDIGNLRLAPLTRDHVLPLLRSHP